MDAVIAGIGDVQRAAAGCVDGAVGAVVFGDFQLLDGGIQIAQLPLADSIVDSELRSLALGDFAALFGLEEELLGLRVAAEAEQQLLIS